MEIKLKNFNFALIYDIFFFFYLISFNCDDNRFVIAITWQIMLITYEEKRFIVDFVFSVSFFFMHEVFSPRGEQIFNKIFFKIFLAKKSTSQFFFKTKEKKKK